MGTYDVKWHAYEQVMKADPAWQKLSSAEKAEQFGRYAQGLQYDEIKAANKLRGQELSVLFAKQKQAQQALDMAEQASQGTRNVTAGQIDNIFGINDGNTGISHDSLQGMYSDLFGRGEQVPMHGYNLVTDRARITAEQINDLHGIGTENLTLQGLNYDYAHLEELSDYKHRIGEHLSRPTEFSPEILDDLTGHGANAELSAMGDYYRALEQADDIVDDIPESIVDDVTEIVENAPKLTPEAQRAYDAMEAISQGTKRHSVEQINRIHGIGSENLTLQGLNYDYAHLEELSDYKHRLGAHLSETTEFSPEILDDLTGHGANAELSAMGDYYAALEQADDAVDAAKGINWGKVGKWAAIGAGVLALAGLVGWGISKLCKKDEAQETPETPEENTTPVAPEVPEDNTTPVAPEVPGDNTTPVAPEVPEENTVPVVPVAPEAPEENTTPVVPVAPEVPEENTTSVTPEVPEAPALKTEYEVQRGDGIWHIAERYLKDKFANEPDKFANLTTSEKNKMILEETLRIAKLNNYELVERTINGKVQTVTNPTLHPGDQVKVQ